MEIFYKVTPILVHLQCDKCKTHLMVPNGKQLVSDPPVYIHQCQNPECDNTISVRGFTYPHLRHVVEPNPLDPQPVFNVPVTVQPNQLT